MAKKFLQGVDLKAQQSRNGFDLSYQNQFTAPFGMLLPCYFSRVLPGDKVRLSNESQTICDGLARPAFMRLKEHIDYYFIPATQLWMPFDNFITGQDSYFSTAVKNIQNVSNTYIPSQVPGFDGKFLQEYFNQNQGIKDELGYFINDGTVRLLDMLGYGNFYKMHHDGELEDKTKSAALLGLPVQNLFGLLAYQKVYYDYFRNPKYEDNLVGAYNIDDVAQGTFWDDLTTIDARKRNIFRIRYRWAKKDYFNITQPNVLANAQMIGFSGLQISPTNGMGIFGVPGTTMGGSTSQNVFPRNVQSSSTIQAQSNEGAYTSVGISKTNLTSASTLVLTASVQNIRFAFAYDKLLRRMREAGADFDKQMLAQFGVSPYDARHGKCKYIGGYTNRLNCTDVTNMTGTDIGTLAGQINSYSDNSQKSFSYFVKEHGFIIGIYSTSCENQYQSFRLRRDNLSLDRFDWANPAFDRLGLQPVFKMEYDYTDSLCPVDSTTPGVPDRGNTILDCNDVTKGRKIMGYVPRYSEFKTKTDEVHGILCKFSDVGDMSAWNMQVYRNDVKNGTPIPINDPFTIRTLLLDPAYMDTVAVVNFDGTQNTDHFIVNMYNHVTSVSSMSKIGEDF